MIMKDLVSVFVGAVLTTSTAIASESISNYRQTTPVRSIVL